MPKLKTHRGAAKRFKKTGTGKIVRASAFKRHILTSKTTKSEAPDARHQARRRDQERAKLRVDAAVSSRQQRSGAYGRPLT